MFAPLECNPDVFNAYLDALGVRGLQFVDVYGLDEDLLQFVPRPVRAILLVFPISSRYEQYRAEADRQQQQQQQEQPAFWSQQTIGNSCGTMALIHALANGVPEPDLGTQFGHALISEFRQLPADKRPQFLEQNTDLAVLHARMAGAGDTAAPEDLTSVESHYVCLTRSGTDLVELDGRRSGPIVRATNVHEPDLLVVPETIATVREFIEREAGSNEFAILALADA